MRKGCVHFLKDEDLKSLNTKRLLSILSSARAVESSILRYRGPRCCEICHEYIGDDWENDVLKYSRLFTEYKEKIKKELAMREHIQRLK